MSEKNVCRIERTLDHIDDVTLRKEIETYIVQNMFPLPFGRAAKAIADAHKEGRLQLYVGYKITANDQE